MAPINLPNGTEVSEIVLPNGQTASEVIAPDGSTVFGAIPDSVVSRTDDNNTLSNSSEDIGLNFSTSQDWPDFQARISSNTTVSSSETAKIILSDGTLVEDKDISNLSANDVVTFTNINLSANTDYAVLLSTNGSRDYGYNGQQSYPYTSNDGNLSITSGRVGGTTSISTTAYAIKEIGNITL